ncbi:response regulator transcription factor [Robertkochia sediminum]|uniref:response regulator transcription factor n=1 Tax=Robertkochia sediminum TaxID=2785326 RepID=UPI0019332D25|nr:helix-turn-helix transcriptional regulator [Robertkochia sediminum]MBL7471518.1 helix-turn-helix transcriptional regulator [Robertkochia sediminum]
MKSSEIIQFWESKYSTVEVAQSNFNLQPFLHGFLSAFSPGHSYHYVANFKNLELKFVSDTVIDFTGVSKEKVTFHDLLAVADDDQHEMIKLKEQVTYDFYFNYLSLEERKKFKVVYLYKMHDPEGRSRIILAQALPLSLDEDGNLENVLSVHTDVSYLCVQPDNSVSYFSLDGRKSYVNINTAQGKFDPDAQPSRNLLDVLTPREKEIVSLLAKGLSSKEISGQLHVSVHTVNKHRKNILAKTQCANTSELVGHCIMAGLLV